MATVTLLGEELVRGDLPRVCIQCGSRRGVEFFQRTFVWRPWFSPWMLLRLIPYRRLAAHVPLCRAHGGFRWFAHRSGQWWGIRPLGIGQNRITLAGVSEEFAAALRRRRDGYEDDRDDGDDWREHDLPDVLPAGDRQRDRGPPEPAPVTDPTWIVPLVLLGVPVLLCTGLCLIGAVANLFLPHPPPPLAGPPPLPSASGPAAPAKAPPEFVGTLAADPAAGFPAALPWPALVLTLPADGRGAPTDAELDKDIADLKDRFGLTAADAASRLASAPPVGRRRVEVAAALEASMAGGGPFVVKPAAEALAVWGGPENVPALVAVLQNPFPDVRQAALKALAAIKDERGAVAVAGRLTDFVDRATAEKTLEAMGPVAEKAVLPYLTNRDVQACVAACHVLKAVGSKESLDALQTAARDRDPAVAAAAAEAVKAVRDRGEQKP